MAFQRLELRAACAAARCAPSEYVDDVGVYAYRVGVRYGRLRSAACSSLRAAIELARLL